MTTEPLTRSVEVACAPPDAFAIWTSRTTLWWPRDHTRFGDDLSEIVIEPRVGGRIFERSISGEEADWGEITLWEPPHRLGYLWHIGADRTMATQVDIAFRATSGGRTRLKITHSGWDRLGEEAPSRREANTRGWNGLLPPFIAACKASGGV